MNTVDLIDKVYDLLEKDDVENAVMTCIRLARLTKDYMNMFLFLRELYPDKEHFIGVFADETEHFNDEAKEWLFQTVLNRWLKGRKVEFDSGIHGDDDKVLVTGIGDIDFEIEQLEKAIEDLKLPEGMDPFDLAAFTDRNANIKGEYRLKMRALNSIKKRVKTKCLSYAIQLEKQLDSQKESGDFFSSAINEVNNYYKQHSDEVYLKLVKASELLNSNNEEDFSLLLTTIRRSIKSVADSHYPSSNALVRCSDGKERQLGDEQYLNRLHEFVCSTFAKSSSDNLLRSELDHLSVFLKRLNEVASKGVHSAASRNEARQGVIGLYMFLFNLVSKLQYQN